jgi:predicted nucleic-acid-binding protein
MRITADTNILVRAITGDDERQSRIAQAELAGAEMVALPLPVLCELVWVLTRGYQAPPREISETIRHLLASASVAVDRSAAEAGLAMLDAGGDFADGVIAYEGRALGADVFVSFDRDAVARLEARGEPARRPG